MFKHVLVIVDIEGSSGCWDYEASRFLTPSWARACVELSLDAACLVRALFDQGVGKVTLKDFHRTGYNLLPELLDSRARVIHGYQDGAVPGLGDPGDAEAVMYLGLHAASGAAGFLAHTMTSRIAALEVNGQPLPEVALFSACLAPFGLRPIFFSGCPLACAQASGLIPGLRVHPIDKSRGPAGLDVQAWRGGLYQAAVEALHREAPEPFFPPGPFSARVVMRDGEKAAAKIARRWGYPRQGAALFLEAADLPALFRDLIRLAYLTPLLDRITGPALRLYNLWGRFGLAWVRGRMKKEAANLPIS